jgi:hypothetical protein
MPSCTDAFDDLEPADPPVPERSCELAEPPPRPVIQTPDIGSVDFVSAIKEYDFGEKDFDGQTERYRSMGYDLDEACTGHGAGPTCETSPWAAGEQPADGPGGRDNGYGEVTARLYREFDSSLSDANNAGINNGKATGVFRVRGYNQQPLDDTVEVAFFAANLNEGGAIEKTPDWLGNDEWAAITNISVGTDEQGQPSLEHPKHVDSKAYVTNWVLVAHFDQLETLAYLRHSQVVITAKVVRTDHGWSMAEGTFAGRIRTDSLLVGLEFIKDEAGLPLCTNNPNYRAYKQVGCGSADIAWNRDADPSITCDATSWGFEFVAPPAKLKGTVTLPDEKPACTTPADSPVRDSCADFD